MRVEAIELGLIILFVSTLFTSLLITTPLVSGVVYSGLNNGSSSGDEINNTSYYFYIYGYSGCPHCRAMKKFLTNTYGSDHVYFCDIYQDRECRELFNELIDKGIPPYVPTVFIVVNCTVSAIVIGENEDKAFIDSLLRYNSDTYAPIYMSGSNPQRFEIGLNHYAFIRRYLSFKNYCSIPHSINQYIYIYVGESNSSRYMVELFRKQYGFEHVFVCNTTYDPSCKALYTEILDKHKNIPSDKPLSFIVSNERIVAVLIGVFTNTSFIEELIINSSVNSIIPIYSNVTGKIKFIGSLDIGDQSGFIDSYLSYNPCGVSRIGFNNETSPSKPYIPPQYSILDVLPALIILAFLDSINPCTMIIYFSFVVMCMTGKRMIGPPILFLVIIYTGYLLLAYGILYAAAFIPKQVFVALALIMGLYNVFHSGRQHTPTLKCEWCEKLGFIAKYMGNKYFLAVLLSTFSVIFLLPCTAGPLAAFIAILSSYPSYIALPSLLLYNAVFITPLTIILVTSTALRKEKRIANWLKNNTGAIEFLSGTALVFIAIYLFFAL